MPSPLRCARLSHRARPQDHPPFPLTLGNTAPATGRRNPVSGGFFYVDGLAIHMLKSDISEREPMDPDIKKARGFAWRVVVKLSLYTVVAVGLITVAIPAMVDLHNDAALVVAILTAIASAVGAVFAAADLFNMISTREKD